MSEAQQPVKTEPEVEQPAKTQEVADKTVKTEAASEEKAAPAAESSTSKSALSKEEAEKEALRQVEFYFSDTNLPFDKFLWTLSRKEDGWVPLATVASFKRMRQIRDTLGEDAILTILQSSSELLEVNAETKKIRRKTEIAQRKDVYERSVYAKGFPDETPTTQQEIEKFFAGFGKISVVRMRRDEKSRDKKFKNSVFTEFESIDEMNEFLTKGKSEEGIKYGEEKLLVMTKDEYCVMKMKEKGIDPNKGKRGGGFERTSKPGSAPLSRPGKFNAFVEMEREAAGLPPSEEVHAENKPGKGSSSSKQADKAPKAKRSDPLEFVFNDAQLVTRADETVEPGSVVFPERSVIAFEGAGEGGHWKELKDSLLEVAPTSFVEYPQGATSGAAGFKDTLPDDKYDEIVAKNIEIAGKPLTFSRVDEERAKQFYVDRANFRAKVLIDQRENPEQGFGNGRGGRGGARGGRGGRGGSSRGGGRGGRGGGRGGSSRNGGSDNRGGEKRKRNDHNDEQGSRGGGSVPSLAKKPKAE